MKNLLLMMFLISLINENNAYAVTEAEQQVVIIEKEAIAPFRGYLFPEDKALKFRKDLLELDTLKEMNASYERSITLYKKNEDYHNFKVNTLSEQNDKLAQAVYQAREKSSFENWMWFGLGVVVTGVGISVGLHNR